MENNKIPKTFHFIWITPDFMNENNNITAGHQIVIDSFKKYNPTYEITVWKNHDIRIIIEQYKEVFKEEKVVELLLSNEISLVQKTDIIRMMILEMNGGIYCDLDTLCVGNFDDLLDNNFFVGEEPAKISAHTNDEVQVASDMHYINNTVIGSVHDNSIIKKYLELVPKTLNKFRISYGPNLVETTLSKCDSSEYKILPSDYFFVKNYFSELDTKKLTKNTKVIHFYAGTGKNGK